MSDLSEAVSYGLARRKERDILCSVATPSIFFFPIIAAISMRASTSSLDWNKGNLPVRKNRSIIPAAHISMAFVVQSVSL
jgi:hypothetical protein